MESELCLQPLHTRRTYLAGKFWLRAKSIKDDVSINTVEQLDRIIHSHYWTRKKIPKLVTVNSMLRDHPIHSSSKLGIHLMSTWVSRYNLSKVIRVSIDGLSSGKRSVSTPDLRSICNQHLHGTYNTHYKLFTDGSKEGRTSGAAFFDPQLGLHARFKIDSNISIMHSELIAISESLSYVFSIDSSRFVILSDSKSALLHLAKLNSNVRSHPIAYSILDSIYKLQDTEKSVVLQWIPSHVGIVGNEEADRAAKQAIYDGITIHQLPLYSEMLGEVKERCRLQWREYFDKRSLTSGIWYKTIQCEPPRHPWFDAIPMCRKHVVTLMRLRSGHIMSNVFKYLMGIVESPKCVDCDMVEDVQHVLIECVRNEVIRQNLRVVDGNVGIGLCNSLLASPSSEEARRLIKLYLFSS